MNDVENTVKSIPLAPGCEIAATDPRGIVAISKRAGYASHPNPGGARGKPMVLAPYNFEGEYFSWEGEDGRKRRLWLANRLDSPTSGIVIAAANPEAAEAAREAFRARKAEKIYRAICVCRAPARSGLWRDTLFERKFAGFVRNCALRTPTGAAKRAEAKFSVEGFDKNNYGVCLVRLEPLTGLTHQLRVQCAKHGMPILGDATYGNFGANKRIRAAAGIGRLFLHCSQTSLHLEIGGTAADFAASAPLPESFGAVMERRKD